MNKIHQARPETEKPFERTKVPKTRTRNKPLSRDRFLVIGGIDPFEVTDYQTSRLVEEYFPGKSEWTAKTSLPDSRHHTCACLLDGFIYLVGEYYRCFFHTHLIYFFNEYKLYINIFFIKIDYFFSTYDFLKICGNTKIVRLLFKES